MTPQEPNPQNRRQFVRLDSVFPVQFRVLSSDGSCLLTDWIQGFTSNVGKGGMCLEVNNLDSDSAYHLKTGTAKLSLSIEMPLGGPSVQAQAVPAWVQEPANQPHKLLIGLRYEKISPFQNKRLIRYAWTKKLFVPVAAAVIIILSAAFLIGSYINLRLINKNRALVDKLVMVTQDAQGAREQILAISAEKRQLDEKIVSLRAQIDSAREARASFDGQGTDEARNRITELETLIARISREQETAQQEVSSLQVRQDSAVGRLARLDAARQTLTQENLDKMYQWLRTHQNPRTGLVMSFEGDSELSNWAFTYDQSLAVLAYTYFHDYERAGKILDFFAGNAERVEGKFLNGYYVNDGGPAEYVVHSGPNLWLGIAAVQYARLSGDNSYLPLAQEIAAEMTSLQDEDSDGGLRGGPEVSWYATEHNLDAYAFFNMLHRLTGTQEYAAARDRILGWLVAYAYDQKDVPIKRGKGDATIATDTYAWSVAAIGPEKLAEVGMNPDQIMDFAERCCAVEVEYLRPEGRPVRVKGFDFAAQRHVARGGVVSSEWTAQMVLSFRIMADYYNRRGLPDKAAAYENKAQQYLAGLSNMIISSPSPSGQGASCLPYATDDFVDTGHGWMTPKGSSTGSVSGTAYTLFAYYDFNPLEVL